ncbi:MULTISPECIES: TIGR03943 family putative permease subunit [Nocardioides]|uniref:TIGR03943 family putative permease subunit n=1 Tax=Nocardioides vastitatis TaxID=2568655 RepID=A0ABW0ZF02_9ACTN|nr:TIGR03943 family protein [Nocardioides sp.]THI97817.1 TIGR03943 family protein [Nocardioides sp.]
MGAAVKRPAQALVLTALGGVALRVGVTDEYARYVNEWMRWPLVASGLLLVALAFTVVFEKQDDDHATTPAAWALLIPVVIAFVVQPPALGSYVAERGVNNVESVSYDKAAIAPLPDGETSDMLVYEFVALAATYGDLLVDHDVRMTGFVTRQGDDWFVTRLTMRCCAADASAFRVRVEGAESPPVDQWVQVTGRWIEGTGDSPDAVEPPAVTATDVTPVDEPRRPYE